MNCNDTRAMLGAFVDGELDLQGSMAVEAHLRECGKCRAAFDGVQALRAAIARACEPSVAPARLRRAVQVAAGAPAGAATARATHATPVGALGRWLSAAPGVAALFVAGWLALAQPWDQADALDDDRGMRVVYHIASGDHVQASLRTLRNHLDATPGLSVVVVAHSDGVQFLLHGASDSDGQPFVPVVRDLRERGVEFRVCTNTLTRRRIDATSVVPEAVLVPSGIAEIGRLQGREGYVYLRL